MAHRLLVSDGMRRLVPTLAVLALCAVAACQPLEWTIEDSTSFQLTATDAPNEAVHIDIQLPDCTDGCRGRVWLDPGPWSEGVTGFAMIPDDGDAHPDRRFCESGECLAGEDPGALRFINVRCTRGEPCSFGMTVEITRDGPGSVQDVEVHAVHSGYGSTDAPEDAAITFTVE